MGRASKVWPRKGRGYWSTINRRQIYLSHDLKEAKRKLASYLKSAQPNLPGQFSVKQLVDLFLAECRDRVESKDMSLETVKSYRTYLLRWAEACRRVKPEQMRAFHVKAWLKSHENWNSTTRADAVSRVKLWSRWCVAEGFLDVDGLSTARAPRRLTRDAADPADLVKLEQAIQCPAFRDWYHVLYDTGCRPGELCGLTADDISGSTAIVTGKTGQRVVGLSQRATEILRRLAVKWPEGSLLRTVFNSEWTQSNIKYHLHKWRDVAGIPETVTSYHCRHDLHRRWKAAGVDDLTIAFQLGHKRLNRPHLSLILSTYGHMEGAALAVAAQQAEHPTRPKRTTRSPRKA